MKPIEYGNLATDAETLDQALYVASCMAGNWSDDTAVVWSTVDRRRREHYAIRRKDERPAERDDSAPWAVAYSIVRGARS